MFQKGQGLLMKKWSGLLLSVLLMIVMILISGPFDLFKWSISKEGEGKGQNMILTQRTEGDEKREEADPHFIQVLKKLRDQLDVWLKSLNDRIENEDVTRFEVRFLEILRSILEWIREKVDSKIESSEGKERERREKKGIFRETLQIPTSPLFRT